MRILGLDYGTVRIGIALSDELLITASPLTVIERRERGAVKEPVREIKEIARKNGVESIVMGLPKNLDNSDGAMTDEVRAFAARLEKDIKLPVVFWDERLSSVMAERALISADVSRRKRRETLDGVAAAVILQSYLDNYDRKKKEEKRDKIIKRLFLRRKLMDKEFEMENGEIDENAETEEFDLIVLEDEETGENIELVIVDSVELEKFSYLLVVPMQEFDDECPNASIIKEYTDESGEYVYEVVEEDEEFEQAASHFESAEEEEE